MKHHKKTPGKHIQTHQRCSETQLKCDLTPQHITPAPNRSLPFAAARILFEGMSQNFGITKKNPHHFPNGPDVCLEIGGVNLANLFGFSPSITIYIYMYIYTHCGPPTKTMFQTRIVLSIYSVLCRLYIYIILASRLVVSKQKHL